MDKASFERLYRELLPGLYRLAQSLLRSEADAQDAVQQAALNAYRALPRMKPGLERAYVTRVVVNECRNIQRARRRVTPVAALEETAAPFAPPDPDLRQAVGRLPEELRLALLLKYMEGYTEKEIAGTLDISVAAVKGRLLRARRRLAEELREEVTLR